MCARSAQPVARQSAPNKLKDERPHPLTASEPGVTSAKNGAKNGVKTVQNGQTEKKVQSHKTLRRKELAQWYELGS